VSRPKPSSRANGRLSRGPRTQAGKDRSKYNGLRHGLYATDEFLFGDTKQPSPEGQLQQAQERIKYLRRVENAILLDYAADQPPGPEEDRMTAAWGEFILHPASGALVRRESQVLRLYYQALAELSEQKKNLRTEPIFTKPLS
jgi:hypothetical protein